MNIYKSKCCNSNVHIQQDTYYKYILVNICDNCRKECEVYVIDMDYPKWRNNAIQKINN